MINLQTLTETNQMLDTFGNIIAIVIIVGLILYIIWLFISFIKTEKLRNEFIKNLTTEQKATIAEYKAINWYWWKGKKKK